MKASIKSELDGQSGKLEEVIGRSNAESQEFLNPKFEKISEDLINVSDKIVDEQAMQSKFEDQSGIIKASIESGLNNQNVKLEVSVKNMLDERSEDFQQNIDAIKTSVRSGLNEQNGKLESLKQNVESKLEEQKEVMEAKLEDQNVKLTKKLEDQSDAIKTSVRSGLDEQNGKLEDVKQNIESKFENQKQIMESKFEDQKENMEGFVENLVQRFEVLFLKQKEDFEKKLGDEVQALQDQKENIEALLLKQKEDFEQKYNDILTAVALNSDFLACPTDWVRVLDSCILVSNEKATFDEAVEKCKEFHSDASLYEPPNNHHSELVFNLLSEDHHWIGIHDRIEEDTWVYLSTNEAISFTSWQDNEPNNLNTENCVEFRGSVHAEKGRLWNDEDCDSKIGFVCETKLIK